MNFACDNYCGILMMIFCFPHFLYIYILKFSVRKSYHYSFIYLFNYLYTDGLMDIYLRGLYYNLSLCIYVSAQGIPTLVMEKIFQVGLCPFFICLHCYYLFVFEHYFYFVAPTVLQTHLLISLSLLINHLSQLLWFFFNQVILILIYSTLFQHHNFYASHSLSLFATSFILWQ